MRILLAALLLLLTASPSSAELEYRWGHPGPQGNAIFGLRFADDQVGWATGRGGTVLHSTDGGTTWTVQRSLLEGPIDLFDLEILPTGTLIVGAEGGKVLRSINGGWNWRTVQTPAAGQLLDVALRADGAVSAAGENGSVVLSLDDGQTWAEIGFGAGTIEHHAWRSAEECYAVGFGAAHRTVDGGAQWTQFETNDFLGLMEVLLLGPQSVVVLHASGHLRSDDGGATWTDISRFVPPFYQRRSVVFDADHWLVTMNGEGAEIWETFDAGLTWTARLNRASVGFPCIERLPSGRILAASDVGDLLSSDDGGITWTQRTQRATGDNASSSIRGFYPRGDDVIFATNERSGSLESTWMRSDDGGLTWAAQPLPASVDRVAHADFHDVSLGMLSVQTHLLRTEDGGASWDSLAVPATVDATLRLDLTRRDRIFLSVLRSNGQQGVLVSEDEGATWNEAGGGLPANFDIVSVFLHPSGGGFCAGEIGGVPRLYRSGDGGETWSPVAWSGWMPTGFDWVDDQKVFAADGRELWRSLDGGLQWQVADAERATAVAFSDSLNGVSLYHFATRVRVTTDGGTTWEFEKPPFRGALPEREVYEGIRALEVNADGDWLLGGDMNRILVASIAGPTAAPATPRADVHRAVRIESAFPNPFNPRVQVQFSLARAGEVRAVIYDLRGRRVRSWPARGLEAGEHELHWDGLDDRGRSVASGQYRVVVRSGGEADGAGVVLVR